MNDPLESSHPSETRTRILQAAHRVFKQKGYEATRTRDIAGEAQVNLALLNYYFKGKETLFRLVMEETLRSFMSTIHPVLFDARTSFEAKLQALIDRYIDRFNEDPELPFFVISEIHRNPNFLNALGQTDSGIARSVFLDQYQQRIASGNFRAVEPLQLLLNLGGLLVFPFLIGPALKKALGVTDEVFLEQMEQRKKFIFEWILLQLKG